jgi:hypothetical protein
MTEQPTPDRDEQDLGPEPAVMPKWVPVLIGLVLVAIAGLAVYTGLRYRESGTLAGQIGGTRSEPRRSSPAPAGEPEAGASLVLPDNTPAANEPVTGSSRAVISGGGAEGVQSSVRIWARRGMVLNVLPDAAEVYVNDTPIGDVRQFNSMDEAFEFAAPGSYNIRIAADGYRARHYVVTVAENAPNDVARITAKLDAQ